VLLLSSRQAIAPEIAITEPTDRSMPPVAMTRVMPSATSSSGALPRRMSGSVPKRCPSRTVMNWLEVNMFTTSRATRMAAGQNSRFFRMVMSGLRWRWSA
jgi:hypothetical protein